MKSNEGLSMRISKIRELFCEGKNNRFAELTGLSPQNASGICNGTKPAGKDTQERILRAFPRISRVWLILGEGEMLKPEPEMSKDIVTITAIGSENVHGKDVVHGSSEEINRLISLLESKNKQLDRLITLLEIKYADIH